MNARSDYTTRQFAIQLADAYRSRVPHWRELVAKFGIDRSTAYRWISDLKAARGIA
ncbi:MAG TPA: helix-turn-helix domain-containing protein [Lysobacter sp.]|nr:helix-turn-helix domain-containing protein [Lysobacter sp.]